MTDKSNPSAIETRSPACNRCGGLGYIQMTDGLGQGSRIACNCRDTASPSSIERSRPQTSYEPLTREQIEEIDDVASPRPALAAMTLHKLCAMAINSLLYSEEIQRLRDAPRSTETASVLEEALYRCSQYHQDDAMLDAPCIFCGYNGAGYWQKGTHAKDCHWHNVGGYDDRHKALQTKRSR